MPLYMNKVADVAIEIIGAASTSMLSISQRHANIIIAQFTHLTRFMQLSYYSLRSYCSIFTLMDESDVVST